MSNVIKAIFPIQSKEANDLADEMHALVNSYSNTITLAHIIGILEMVKADVLDSMKN